jgi:hypothetical protein
MKESHSKDHPLYTVSKLLMNSLYGRFGMNYDLMFHSNRVVDNEELLDLIDNNTITEILNLENNNSLISIVDDSKIEDSLHDNVYANVSISLASAVTAYSRIFMSYFKMKYKNNLLYSDTDSMFLDCELDPKYVGKGLGQWKLEYDLKEAVFLAPKVYGGIFNKPIKKEFTKIKGFKELVTFKQLKSLLKIDSYLNLTHEKWFKSLSKGEITIKNQIYKLMPTSNKRKLIYKNNKLIDTKPFIINKNKEIIE